jgi:hypothetical protein
MIPTKLEYNHMQMPYIKGKGYASKDIELALIDFFHDKRNVTQHDYKAFLNYWAGYAEFLTEASIAIKQELEKTA